MMSKLMQGKRGLIMGLANDRSLAWGIAKALHEHGAELAISYQGEVMEKRVRPLAEQLGCDFLIDCDVATEDALDDAFARLSARWPTIDFIVHAIGYTNKEALRGKYSEVTLDDFLMTMNISVFSFTAVAKRAAVFQGGETFPDQRAVDHPESDIAALPKPHGCSHKRQAVGKVRGAVHGVDDPGIFLDAGVWGTLFRQKTRARQDVA